MNVFTTVKISHKLPDAITLLATFIASLMPRLKCSKAKNIFIAKSKKRLTPQFTCRTVLYGSKPYGPHHDTLASFGAFVSFWVCAIIATNCERIGVWAHHASVDRLIMIMKDGIGLGETRRLYYGR
ncbi:MAG: hypothetical protein COA43_06355 [Robiginitomaculum sp.]|nr:MAG: hypothetical protein COA43_06355 [Robiginitomaculum sp.]